MLVACDTGILDAGISCHSHAHLCCLLFFVIFGIVMANSRAKLVWLLWLQSFMCLYFLSVLPLPLYSWMIDFPTINTSVLSAPWVKLARVTYGCMT